jgi:hypothetical protein
MLALLALQGCGKKGPIVVPQKAKIVLNNSQLEVREGRVRIELRPPMGLLYLSSGGAIVAYELIRQEGETLKVLDHAKWRLIERKDALETQGMLPKHAFQDDRLTPGRVYRYKIRTVNEEGFSEFESPTFDLVFVAPPPSPSIRRIEERDGSILLELSFPPIEGQRVRYHLYLFESGHPIPDSPSAILSEANPTYVFKSLKNGTPYSVIARSALLSGNVWIEGQSSEPAHGIPKDTTPPLAPTRLQAVSTINGVQLFWDPSPDSDVSGYVLYRSEPGKEFVPLYQAPLSALSYLDDSVEPSVRYRYRVVAFDEAGNASTPSQETSIIFRKTPR